MKYALLIIVFGLAACTQPNRKVVNKNNVQIKPDTSKYVILRFDRNRDSADFGNKVSLTHLSNGDIAEIERLILKRTVEYNKEEEKEDSTLYKDKAKSTKDFPYDNLIHHPEKYYKQLIAVTNSKGEKVVWVNCFCDEGDKSYWKKDIVRVMDGGSCYFQLKINLTTNKVLEFYINGLA